MISPVAFATHLMSYGEAIHGGPTEIAILERVAEEFPEHRKIGVDTKYWETRFSELSVNGSKMKHVIMPYTSGCFKGRVGRNVKKVSMPEHPFMIKRVNPEGYEGILFYDRGKLRRITLPQGFPPSAFVSVEPQEGEYVEFCGETRLTDRKSFNLEVTAVEGDTYIVIAAHVDHWLTGFHDNLLSVGLLTSLMSDIRETKVDTGIKLLFLSSEEGPRCCTGSQQYDEKDIHSFISLDAIYPSREVISATPDLWFLSKNFRVKRVEMPTPFSDHFPIVLKGYPGMVIYNDDMATVYHSDQDLPILHDREYVMELKSSLLKAIEELGHVSRERLDETFMKYAREAGYVGKDRRGAIVPNYEELTSRFRDRGDERPRSS